jgi:hypothetical protein
MLFGVTVTIILYFINLYGAISDTKLILNISRHVSKSIPKTYMSIDCCKNGIFEKIFPVNNAQTYACLLSNERKL